MVLSSVPDGKSKHPAKSCKALLTPKRIRLQQDFRIRMADERTAILLQFTSDFAEVVDLAVIDDPITSFQIVHGLVPQRGKIENRKPAVSQPDFDRKIGVAEQDGARVVWAAVGQRDCTSFDKTVSDAGLMRDNSENSTHLVSQSAGDDSIKHYEDTEMAAI